MKRVFFILEKPGEFFGHIAIWLVVPMIAVTFMVAVLRYGFDVGWVWMQEVYVWLHATIFLAASATALRRNQHVRIDIFYRNFSKRSKAKVNLFGTLVLLFPAMSVLLWYIFPYVLRSWQRLETSPEAGGLSGLYILKSMLVLFCALLLIEGFIILRKSICELKASDNYADEEMESNSDPDSGIG